MKKAFPFINLLRYIFIHLFILSVSVNAQHQHDIVHLDVVQLAKQLEQAPKCDMLNAKVADNHIVIPLPYYGKTEANFRVMENELLSEKVAKRFPNIKTYSIQLVDNPTVIGAVTISPHGFFANYLVDGNIIGIRPLDVNNPIKHEVEIGLNLSADEFENGMCGLTDKEQTTRLEALDLTYDLYKPSYQKSGATSYTDPTTGEVLKRKYDLIVVATGEFTIANGGTTASAMTVITNTVNCVNTIFNKDMAVCLNVVETCIFTNPATDPFIPDNASSASGLGVGPSRTRQAADAVEACSQSTGTPYDVGHAFHTHDGLPETDPLDDGWSGGGVAGLGVICSTTPTGMMGFRRASGWSGSFNNTTNGWCQLATHEFGHMFGAPHTFNGTGNSCTTNIGSTSSYEIASGTTIMSYNGICGAGQNIPGSGTGDNYFHAGSIQIMTSYLSTVSCQTDCPTGNMPPTGNADPCSSGTVSIPIGTPFKLQASGADPDGDPLLYTWEQLDEDGTGTPTQGATLTQPSTTNALTAGVDPLAPLFRSYPPSNDPCRYFPNLTDYVGGATVGTEFEVLPQVPRTLTFALTVRDCNPNGSGTFCDSRTINVVSGGPLEVNSPCASGPLNAGDNINVTWNTNGSNAACNNVDVLMSTDGGLTFPYTLANGVAYSSGTAAVMIPMGVVNTTQARFQVICADSPCASFFAVSPSDCTINSNCMAQASFICPATPVTAPACSPAANLNLTEHYGNSGSSFTANIDGTNPFDVRGLATVSGGTTCTTSGNRNYVSFNIMSVTGGTYNVSRVSNGFLVVSIFDAAGFSTSAPCSSTFVGSNGYINSTGGTSASGGFSATLAPCTEYTVMMYASSSAFGQNTVTFSGGGLYILGGNPGANYPYTYIAVDQAIGNIMAVDANADFTTLGVGCYDIYGVNYENDGTDSTPPADVNPTTFISQTMSAVLSTGACALFSANSTELCITPSNIISNVALNGMPACNGTDAEYTVCFDVAGGSGNYDLVDVNNSNAVITSITGQPTTGTGICFTNITVPNTTTASTITVNVVDNSNPSCAEGMPIMVTIPACACSAAFTINSTTSTTNTPFNTINFCTTDTANLTVVITGDMGGTFAATPAGLNLDATTGAIDISASTATITPYTVTYTDPTNTCSEVIDVVITAPVTAGTAEPALQVCNIAGTPTITLANLLMGEDTGGTWTETSGTPSTGTAFDATAGTFDPIGQTAGTYTFQYEVMGGACPNDTETVTVEIIDPCCDAGFVYGTVTSTPTIALDTLSLCTTDPATGNPTVNDTTGTFSATPTGLTITPTGDIDPTTSTPGTYIVEYAVTSNGGCSEFINVQIDAPVTAGTAEPAPQVCNITTVATINLADLLTGEDTGGTWTETSGTPSAGTAFDATAGTFNPVGQVAGTYTFQYEVMGGACPNDTETVTVEIIDPCCPTLNAWMSDVNSVCDGGAVNFSVNLAATGLVEGTDYTVDWAGPSGNLTTGNGTINMVYGGTGCTETQTYTVTVFCNNTNQMVAQETLNIDVSPNITATPVDEDECIVGINYACTNFVVTWDDQQGNTGTGDVYDGNLTGLALGTVLFTISNPNAPTGSSCAQATFPVDFICCDAEAGVISVDYNCPEDPVDIAITLAQTNTDYTSSIIVTDINGNILNVIAGPAASIPYINFDNPPYLGTGQTYLFYAYNELTTNPAVLDPTTAGNVGNIGTISGCFDLSFPQSVFISAPLAVDCDVEVSGGVNGGVSPFYFNIHNICVSGGTPPYNYQWMTQGFVRQGITGLGQIKIIYADNATWSVTISDSNGCANADWEFSSGSTSLNIQNYTVSPATFAGGCSNGTLSIDVVGGTPPYTYNWATPFNWSGNITNSGANNETSTVNNAVYGWYSVTVMDALGDVTSGWYWLPCKVPGRGKQADITKEAGITAYPNPFSTSTQIYFSTTDNTYAKVSLLSIDGRQVDLLFDGQMEAGQTYEAVLQSKQLAEGIYILRLTTENGLVSYQKIIVAK